MLARKVSKDQLALPEAVVARFADVEYFEVSMEGLSIVLRPIAGSDGDEIRERLAGRGIEEKDVDAAVSWARSEP